MLHDLRYALRGLRRSPLFAASAIAALALGIGANTAVFSVVYAVLLKPLPYPQPDRLVRLSESNVVQSEHPDTVSAGTFLDWRARTRTLSAMAAFTMGGQALWTIGDRVEPVKTSAVSPPLFAILGASPLRGRAFGPETERSGAEYVISYDFWQRAFGGAPDAVGRTVQVEGRFSGRIIGVMPKDFSFPAGTDAWTKLSLEGQVSPARRRALSYPTIARLSPRIDVDQVRAELEGLSRQLAVEHPDSNAGWTPVIVPLQGSDSSATRPALLALVAAVAAILLIACVNVANLLLARASDRRRELAVRLALGAGAPRLVWQCLSEALLIASAGTLAAVGVAQWISRGLVRVAPADIPRLADVRLNIEALAFAACAGLLCSLVVGLAPALHAVQAERDGALRLNVRGTAARGALLRRLLIAAEVGAVVLLLTGAALLMRTFVKLRGVDLGFQPQQVLTVQARWPTGRLFPATRTIRPWPRIQHAIDGLIAAVASVPGVEAVGLITDVPLTGDPFSGAVWRADAPGASGLKPPQDPHDRWRADLSVVTPGYFPAMGIPILRGRSFSDTDRLTDDQLNASDVSPGVVEVNDAFARHYFPGEDPVGRTLVVHDDQTFGWLRTIVGVTGDVRGHAVAEPAVPTVYVPHAQHPDVFVPSLVVRTSRPFEAIAPAIRARINAYDPQLLVQRVEPMDAVVTGALSRPRFNLLLVGSFAIVALALAAVGISGVVGFMVARRTQEIGVRIALGARTPDVLRLVVGDAMAPVLLGTAAGLAMDLVATRWLRSMLFGVTPLDPVSLIGAPLALVVIALLACYLPARRALRIDPLVALREE